MADPIKKTAVKVDDTAAPESSDAAHWTYQQSTADWPAGDGPHVEQVYKGIPPAKD